PRPRPPSVGGRQPAEVADIEAALPVQRHGRQSRLDAVDELAAAVGELARVGLALDEAQLSREYNWGPHAEELRLAFLGTYHELRALAVGTAAERAERGPRQSIAQRILAQHRVAFRELYGALVGLPDDALDRAPAEDEW